MIGLVQSSQRSNYKKEVDGAELVAEVKSFRQHVLCDYCPVGKLEIYASPLHRLLK